MISRIKADKVETCCLASKNNSNLKDFMLKMRHKLIAPHVDNPHFNENDPDGQREKRGF